MDIVIEISIAIYAIMGEASLCIVTHGTFVLIFKVNQYTFEHGGTLCCILLSFSFSTFHDINISNTPDAVFTRDLINEGDKVSEDISLDLLFNFAGLGIIFDSISGYISGGSTSNGFALNKQGTNMTSGRITMSSCNCGEANNFADRQVL